jgi:LmbE family N-acetylglucosaminyl deacetylase
VTLPPADPRPDAEVERALVVVAHPDDIDFGGAGTVAGWTAAGIEVTYCIVTDGQAGGFEPDRDRAEIPQVRRAEQTAAARRVGVQEVRFLGYVDGELEPSAGLVQDLVRVIREVRPERVLTQSPERNWARLHTSHPDHLACAEACVRAVYPAAENPFAFPALDLDAWKVTELWMMEHPERNHWVDITDTLDAKIEALLSHASQHPDPAGLPDLLRGWLARNAAEGGLADGRLAESFAVIRLA